MRRIDIEPPRPEGGPEGHRPEWEGRPREAPGPARARPVRAAPRPIPARPGRTSPRWPAPRRGWPLFLLLPLSGLLSVASAVFIVTFFVRLYYVRLYYGRPVAGDLTYYALIAGVLGYLLVRVMLWAHTALRTSRGGPSGATWRRARPGRRSLALTGSAPVLAYLLSLLACMTLMPSNFRFYLPAFLLALVLALAVLGALLWMARRR